MKEKSLGAAADPAAGNSSLQRRFKKPTVPSLHRGPRKPSVGAVRTRPLGSLLAEMFTHKAHAHLLRCEVRQEL